MARENPSCGEGQIADELSLKLGLFVDPRTIGKHLSRVGGRVHDLDSVFSAEVDAALNDFFDLQVLKTPVSKPDGERLL